MRYINLRFTYLLTYLLTYLHLQLATVVLVYHIINFSVYVFLLVKVLFYSSREL